MQEQHPLQQPAYPSGSNHALEQMQAELRQQRKMIEENHHLLVSMRRAMRVSVVFTVLKILLFLVPLVLAAVFLPPYIREWLETVRSYQNVISGSPDGQLQGLDIDQLRQLLQKTGMFER